MLPYCVSDNLYNHIKEWSRGHIRNNMDVDLSSIQPELHNVCEDSALMLDASRHASENMLVSSGLRRYCSAPRSMPASITEEDQESVAPLNRGDDAEFAQFLTDTLSPIATSEDTDRTALYVAEISDAAKILNNQQHSSELPVYEGVMTQHTCFKTAVESNVINNMDGVSLSAILENGPELNSDTFCGSRTSISHTQQGTHDNPKETGSITVGSTVLSAGTAYTGTSQDSGSLARHSSLPAGLLSQLALEEYGEAEKVRRPGSCLRKPYLQLPFDYIPNGNSKQDGLNLSASCYGMTSTFTATSIAIGVSDKKTDELDMCEALTSSRTGGLLRQNSSPAGLFSRLPLDGIMEINHELMTPSASGNFLGESGLNRRVSAFVPNFGGGVWDNAVSPQGNTTHGNATFAAKKRFRQLEAEFLTGSSLLDSHQMTVLERVSSLPAQFSMESATSPESQLTVDIASSDAVLCRTRAKRGCATHPRSVAERVRRTKISERMKKLQELVPNMDKQTSTAHMLDEAVEYVKLLQRQVKELSENQHKCSCSYNRKAS